jgi:exocyst complex protein 7
LKESFAAVNAAIDSIRQQCGQFIVHDVDLQARLRSEGKASIVDLYKRYYDKFAHKDFTKNRDKYIRYEPRAFELIIETLF